MQLPLQSVYPQKFKPTLKIVTLFVRVHSAVSRQLTLLQLATNNIVSDVILTGARLHAISSFGYIARPLNGTYYCYDKLFQVEFPLTFWKLSVFLWKVHLKTAKPLRSAWLCMCLRIHTVDTMHYITLIGDMFHLYIWGEPEQAPHKRYIYARIVYGGTSVTRTSLHIHCTVAAHNVLHCKVCVLKTCVASNTHA